MAPTSKVSSGRAKRWSARHEPFRWWLNPEWLRPCHELPTSCPEGALFRAVLVHSLLLALIVGLIVMMYAYVFPGAIPQNHHFL